MRALPVISAVPEIPTVLVGDNTLGLANPLLSLLHDVIWGVVGEADNNGFLGSDSHGGSGEQCGQDGKSSEAHFGKS